MNIGGNNINLAKRMQNFILEKKGDKGAGISAAIVIDSELIGACAAGVRGYDRTPADIDDLYNIGSVSKIYCSMAVMKLVEMGKADLDEKIIKYLPRFRMRDERYKDITVRMLLNHSSGLPGSNYRNAIAHKWTGGNIIEENYEYFSHCKLKANPGAFSVYCNDGFDAAAAIVEELSGMPYIEFLRKFIAIPAGALSTGIGNLSIDGREMMSCLDNSLEWITAIGAGAIRTSLSDCARFGYLFVEPRNVIGKEYLEEMCRPQGVTFLKNDSRTPLYGLGWDTVELMDAKVDLGEHTLVKGGGTAQFISSLVVSKKYRLSAAISGTNDCGIDIRALIFDLIDMAMKDRGIDIAVKLENISEQKPGLEPVPQEWMGEHEKIYYASGAAYKIDIRDNRLSLMSFSKGGTWQTSREIHDLQWNNGRFGSDDLGIMLEEYEDKKYIIKQQKSNKIPFAQRNKLYPMIDDGWQRRIGKKYLACNVSAYDLYSIEGIAIIIERFEDDGVIIFMSPADSNILSAISCSGEDTDMFLNIPATGSRDIYAPYIFRKDGIEYLRNSGYIYIDAENVPELKTGRVTSPAKEQNAVFKTKAGTKLEFEKPNDTAVFMFDEKLSMVYNSHNDNNMPEICDGYIIFANDGPMDFDIAVKKEMV